MERRRLTAILEGERRRRPRRLVLTSTAAAIAPPLIRRIARRRPSDYLPQRRRAAATRVAAVFQHMLTPGGGSAPALLVHRLGASFPRVGILDPWPPAFRPRSAALIESPAPPEPTAHRWPPIRRRRNPPPGARARVILPRRGLAWSSEANLPTPYTEASHRRRGFRRANPPRRQPTTWWAAFAPRPTLGTELLVRDKRRRRPAPRPDRIRRGERLAALSWCRDPAMAAARFLRAGSAASTFAHLAGGAAAEFATATFTRAGAAASTLYRSRC